MELEEGKPKFFCHPFDIRQDPRRVFFQEKPQLYFFLVCWTKDFLIIIVKRKKTGDFWPAFDARRGSLLDRMKLRPPSRIFCRVGLYVRKDFSFKCKPSSGQVVFLFVVKEFHSNLIIRIVTIQIGLPGHGEQAGWKGKVTLCFIGLCALKKLLQTGYSSLQPN